MIYLQNIFLIPVTMTAKNTKPVPPTVLREGISSKTTTCHTKVRMINFVTVSSPEQQMPI